MTATCQGRGCTAPAGRGTRGSRGYCEPCYRRRQRIGLYARVDGAQVLPHIQRLRALGWTWEQIGDAAGVTPWAALTLHSGQTRSMRHDTAAALLAIAPRPIASHRGIDSAGTRRRLQALAWMGWSCPQVAARAGTTARTLHTLSRPERRISAALARRVAAVYDELCMTPGPSLQVASRARRAGYLPPLAWDDAWIDAPDGELEELLAGEAHALDDSEVRRIVRDYYAGDRAPMTVAVHAEYLRRRSAREKQHRRAA